MSSAKDLGTRHVCWKCETKFYDLNKPSPACPKCGADPRESPALKVVPKPAKVAAPPPAEKPMKRVTAEDEEEEFEDDSFEELEEESDEEGEEEDIF